MGFTYFMYVMKLDVYLNEKYIIDFSLLYNLCSI